MYNKLKWQFIKYAILVCSYFYKTYIDFFWWISKKTFMMKRMPCKEEKVYLFPLFSEELLFPRKRKEWVHRSTYFFDVAYHIDLPNPHRNNGDCNQDILISCIVYNVVLYHRICLWSIKVVTLGSFYLYLIRLISCAILWFEKIKIGTTFDYSQNYSLSIRKPGILLKEIM